MTPLRIARTSGFGSKPPQDFDQSPITFGTASSSTVQFDATFDKGAAPQHCRLEWNGEGWWLLDGGYPEGTWVEGRRLTEPCRVAGELTFSLGSSGPKVSVKEMPAAVSPAALPTPSEPQRARSSSRRHIAVVLLVLIMVVAAVLAWPLLVPKPKGLQPPAGGDGTTIIADGPQGEAVYLPPNVDPLEAPTYQIGDDHDPEHLMTWLPMEPAYEGSGYVQEWSSSGSDDSAFLSNIAQMQSEFALMMEPRYEPEPGGGLPPQPEAAEWSTDDVKYATDLLETAIGDDGRSKSGRTSRSKWVPGDRAKLRKKMVNSRDDAAPQENAVPQANAAPNVWAVIVGVDDYENINDIVGCKNDAAAVAKILMLHGLLHPSRLYLMTEKMGGVFKPTGANIKKALNEALSKAAPQDLVVIYFSGHGGVDEASGETVFTGVNFNFDDPLDTGLSGSALQALISRTAATKVLMFFDACRSGGLAPLGRAPRTFRSGPSPGFLEELTKGKGHVVIRASGKDESSIGDEKLNHGIFTFVTLAGLTGAADRDKDGIVTLNELRPYVTKETPKLAKQLGHDVFHPSFTSAGQQGESGDIPLTVVPKKKK